MNICNAELYLDEYDEAMVHADGAISQSDFCKGLLQNAIKGKSGTERSRLETLLESQIQIYVKAYEAKGTCFESMKSYEQAKIMFDMAAQSAKKEFGAQSTLYKQMEKRIMGATAKSSVKRVSIKTPVREHSPSQLK